MTRRIVVLALGAALVMLAAIPAIGGGWKIRASVGSLVIDAEGTGVGAKAGSATFDLSNVSAILLVECTNAGGNPAPGVNLVTVVVDPDAETFPIKGGKVVISGDDYVVDDPEVTAAEACSNPNWTARVLDTAWNGFTVTVRDSGNKLLFQQDFACVPEFGLAPGTELDCTEV